MIYDMIEEGYNQFNTISRYYYRKGWLVKEEWDNDTWKAIDNNMDDYIVVVPKEEFIKTIHYALEKIKDVEKLEDNLYKWKEYLVKVNEFMNNIVIEVYSKDANARKGTGVHYEISFGAGSESFKVEGGEDYLSENLEKIVNEKLNVKYGPRYKMIFRKVRNLKKRPFKIEVEYGIDQSNCPFENKYEGNWWIEADYFTGGWEIDKNLYVKVSYEELKYIIWEVIRNTGYKINDSRNDRLGIIINDNIEIEYVCWKKGFRLDIGNIDISVEKMYEILDIVNKILKRVHEIYGETVNVIYGKVDELEEVA